MACADNNNKEKFKTYDIEFYEHRIKTTVTANPQSMDQWISELYHIHKNKHHCLILQLSHAKEISMSLVDFLKDKNVTFAGVGINQDAKKLSKDWGLSAEKTMDIAFSAAKKYGQSDYKCKGLKCLAEILLGKVMEKQKDVIESRWEAEELSFDQVKYACIDALVSFLLGMKIASHDE